ncbi:MAG: hypothetical protein U5K73_09650 [Halofilum sp. (in: g-proteobacteria)]|nr:hypothetical protein [Halofilum sp. (in: g-proteobacteria)]
MEYSEITSASAARNLPRVRTPGIPTLPAGLERYRVVGGGTMMVPVEGGDRITIIDVEGRQTAEVVAFSGGRVRPEILGARAGGSASGLEASRPRTASAASVFGPSLPASRPCARRGAFDRRSRR